MKKLEFDTFQLSLLEEYFKEIEELKILGGEPFLDKRYIELLKKVPKNIKLMILEAK